MSFRANSFEPAGKVAFGETAYFCTVNLKPGTSGGRCRNQCPFGAVADYVSGYKVYIGGRWGKKVAQGRALSRIFTTEDEVMAVTEKAIELFRTQGIDGERFADTVARLGFENVERMLIS